MSESKVEEVRGGLVIRAQRERLSRLPWLVTLKHFLAKQSRRRLAIGAALLGMALTIPAYWVGFAQDDYFFLAIFDEETQVDGLRQPITSTFTFSEGDPARNRIRMEQGILPWWAVAEWQVDMWRPIASLSHWVDYTLFGATAWPMQLQNHVLYGVLCALVVILYSRFLSPWWVVGLAGLLYAVDASHGIAVGWISNRNALMGAIFAVLALLAHHQWRKAATGTRPLGNWYPWAPISLALLTVGLFSSESTVALGGYLFAYSLVLDPVGPFSAAHTGDKTSKVRWECFGRVFAYLLPYLAVVVTWRLIYTGLGHGTYGSWMYVDPLSEPLVFLRNLVQYYPVLLLGLFGLPDSTMWAMLPEVIRLGYVAAAIIALTVMGTVLWPLLRRDHTVRFWLIGSLVATVPFCATLPTDRNLIIPSIGALAIVAVFIQDWIDARERRMLPKPKSLAVFAVFWFWIAAHLVLSPLMLTQSSYSIALMDNAFKHVNASVPSAASESERRVIAVNTPLDLLGASYPIYQAAMNEPAPTSWWWLCAGDSPVQVERLDERTLVLNPEGGFLRRPWSQIFRRPDTHPFAEGDTVRLSSMEAKVLDVSQDGRPMKVAFRFDKPLEDTSYQWVTWSRDRYVAFEPPRPGESARVPGFDFVTFARLALNPFAKASHHQRDS